MESSLNELEIACIKRLAELYEMREFDNGAAYEGDPTKELGLPSEKWESVLLKMQEHRAIDAVVHGPPGVPFFSFRISPNALQLAKRIDENQKKAKQKEETPRNIVEEVQERMQSNRVFATLILVAMGVSAIAVPLAAILAAIYYSLQIRNLLAN